MIRPITCICFLLACGSGLYLYQSKHRVQVLDRQIEQTVRATDLMREQIRVLHAEWTLMNDPQRLQALAEQFLSLKTVAPGQFTNMAELDNRMPAIRPPEPPPQEPVVMAIAPSPLVQPEEPPRQHAPSMVAPPIVMETAKPTIVAAAPPPRPPERKPAPPRPLVAQTAPPKPEIRSMPEIRPAVAPEPARTAVAAPAAAGSMLGMAHGILPPPRPMPVNASQWITGSGGGG